MTWCNAAIRLACLAALCVLAGCGDSADESEETSTDSQQSITLINKTDPAKVAPSKLSTSHPVLVEKGKLEVFEPLGWHPVSPRSEYLVKFTRGGSEAHTWIKVHVEDYSTLKKVTKVTKENQARFVEQIQQALDKELDNPKVLIQKVAPITLEGITPEGDKAKKNDFIGAHYVRRGTAKTSAGKSLNLDRLFLVTVVDGRKYSVELQTLAKTVHETREFAHAVAAGMRFYDAPKTNRAVIPKKKATFDDTAKPAGGKVEFDDSAKPAP